MKIEKYIQDYVNKIPNRMIQGEQWVQVSEIPKIIDLYIETERKGQKTPSKKKK